MFSNKLFFIFAKQSAGTTFVTPGTGLTLYRDFVGDKQLNGPVSVNRVGPNINFFRNSQATYIDSLSTITIASVNVPRFNYSSTGEYLGLLIEDQATNLVPYSQNFTSWIIPASGVTLTSNISGIIAPDGTETATLLQPTTAFDFHVVTWDGTPAPYIGEPPPGTPVEIYNRSIFVKKETARYLVISCSPEVSASAGGGNPDFEGVANIFDFDLPGFVEAIESVPVPSYQKYKNDWYRISLTRASSNLSTNRLTLGISNGPAFEDCKFSGDNNSLSGVYIWGGQVEKGDFSSSYIPTNGTEVIRASDNASIQGTPFTSIYNLTSGTYFTTVNHNGVFDTRAISTFISTNNQKYITLGTSVSGLTHIFTNTSSPSSMVTDAITSNQFYNLAIGLQNDNFALYRNNTLQSTLTSGQLPQPPFRLSRFELGQFNGTKYLNGHIQKLGYYAYRLTNQQLSAL